MATRYRDLIGPTALQTGIVDNSAAQTAARLAETFKQFESTANMIGGELMSQAGAKAGSAEGAAGTPQPRTGMAAMTKYGAAYNSAAEVTYTNKLQIDLGEQLSRAEQDANGDPSAYAARAKGILDGTVQAAPPEWRTQIEQMVQGQVAAGTIRVERQAHAQELDDAEASYDEWAPAAIEQFIGNTHDVPSEVSDQQMTALIQDNAAKLQTLHERGAISATEKVKRQAAFVSMLDKALANSHVDSAVGKLTELARVNVEKSDALYAEIQADPTLSPEEKNQIANHYWSGLSDLNRERARTYLNETTALSKSLASGATGLDGTARALYRRGALTLDQYQSAVDQSTRNGKVKAETDTTVEAIQTLANAGKYGLDPGNKDHRAAVNTAFDAAAQQQGWQPGDPNFQANALAFTEKWNILPSAAESWARTVLVSGDPVAAASGAQFFAKVRGTKTGAYAWNSEPKLEVLVDNINRNTEAGLDPVAGYELARKNYDMKDAERKLREDEYAKTIKDNPNTGVLSSTVNSPRHFWQSSLQPPIAMQAEYDSLVHQYFLLSGSIEQARQLAAEKVQATWGVSNVNGQEEILKHPPEKYGVTPEAVQRDLTTSLLPLAAAGKPLRLSPIPETDWSNGLVWGVETTDAYGNPDTVLRTDNRPLRYALPLGEDYQKVDAEIRARKVAEAIQQHAEDVQREQRIQENLARMPMKVR